MRGHIRRRGTRSWAIVIDLGRDPATGKRRQRWVSVKGTKRDAQRRLTELLRRYDTGTWMEPSRITVAEFLERYAVKVETLVKDLVGLVQLAPPEAAARQSATLLLRHCAASKAAHLLRLLPPDQTSAMVERIDAAVLHAQAS